MECPRSLVAYKGCRGDLRSLRLSKCVCLALFSGIVHYSIVYVVLFDTNGAHNRGSSRVDRGGNVEIEFASGWFSSVTEVDVCILH